ncbi:MAG: LacI family DNA-binding transcriptional regulator, partial [Micromonosporaceae bacterium]
MSQTRESRPRLQDVAVRAGVSMKTVSNVINDFPHVTVHTRERVMKAIEELGYQPNLSARNLARGRSGVIALAVPELDMPYFAELSRLVLEAAERHGWVVLIEQTKGRRDHEQRVVSGAFPQRLDGLIFSPVATRISDLRQRRDTTPLVLLGEHLSRGPADHISIDNVAAARAATEHLISLGRRRIAVIGSSSSGRGASQRRLEGYKQALTHAGLPIDRSRILPAATYRGEVGATAMAKLLELPEPPDAVFCFTDWLALGALRTLRLRGYRVPDDVAVVGFDDIPYGRIATPSLSTISPDKKQIAELAVDRLAERVGNRRPPEPREIDAGFELIPRESTLGIP